ncbi:hypothetical protein AXG93_620s1280 [Marchantia polymorpha subsp. ruderalis]|uniref:Uncharacterized protein n=1 Tax=Marchantia polymorpha subsp. ruderalis TaxID=1480154 RepID=A0A176VSE7_MARPO|nr:hypothetical protein AXG93_620s1280 [Marchantia polymorpha subsp. ruderalis]
MFQMRITDTPPDSGMSTGGYTMRSPYSLSARSSQFPVPRTRASDRESAHAEAEQQQQESGWLSVFSIGMSAARHRNAWKLAPWGWWKMSKCVGGPFCSVAAVANLDAVLARSRHRV